jgi:hypothetical protein
VRQATLVPDHPLQFIGRAVLGDILCREGRFQEAEVLLLEARAALVEDLGPEHPQVRDVERYLGRLYGAWGRPREAARF